MKKFFLFTLLTAGIVTTQFANAQVSINVNIGNQPQWGPHGYNQARYYYIPELNMYYDVFNRSYIYQSRRSWTQSRTLPVLYRNFDFYNTYKVVVNSNSPWKNNPVHRRNYARYRYDRSQVSIRDHHYRNQRNRGHDRYENSNNGYRDHSYDRNYHNNRITVRR